MYDDDKQIDSFDNGNHGLGANVNGIHESIDLDDTKKYPKNVPSPTGVQDFDAFETERNRISKYVMKQHDSTSPSHSRDVEARHSHGNGGWEII